MIRVNPSPRLPSFFFFFFFFLIIKKKKKMKTKTSKKKKKKKSSKQAINKLTYMHLQQQNLDVSSKIAVNVRLA